ncbi:hypothetical protein PTE30175_02356 [Pandoraea terrae]|uniref:Uncharacterized protein n=1 Tax=Pandoraea terrae TaxID=1537710 RepID=A0A5E4V5L1_9BURK|nr:hypothetical protein [Pandoraea terrae]VVE06844.1 hypothetical protein PTE30175_02356 [Pandoraea terrae]
MSAVTLGSSPHRNRTRLMLAGAAIAVACLSGTASARTDVGVYFGIPAPVYAAPPVVYQEAPPPVVYEAPPVVYQPVSPPYYGYRYDDDDREHRYEKHWRKRWEHRHGHDDDD